MKGFLDRFAAILGAVTVGLLLLSVIHEYGYFLIIGSRLQALLTTSDYFANAIVWLPFFAIMTYGYLDIDALKGGTKFGKFGEMRGIIGKLVWLGLVVGFPIFFLLFFEELSLWMTAVILCGLWFAYVARRLPFSGEEDDRRYAHRFLVLMPVAPPLWEKPLSCVLFGMLCPKVTATAPAH